MTPQVAFYSWNALEYFPKNAIDHLEGRARHPRSPRQLMVVEPRSIPTYCRQTQQPISLNSRHPRTQISTSSVIWDELPCKVTQSQAPPGSLEFGTNSHIVDPGGSRAHDNGSKKSDGIDWCVTHFTIEYCLEDAAHSHHPNSSSE